MSRIRSIKPSFFRDVDLGELPPVARLLFAGLWTEADREGRVADKPRQLKIDLLPFDDCDCDALLALLAGRGFIERYEVDGHAYLQIHNWARHQCPNVKETASTIPAPCVHSASTIPAHVGTVLGKGREKDTKSSPCPSSDSGRGNGRPKGSTSQAKEVDDPYLADKLGPLGTRDTVSLGSLIRKHGLDDVKRAVGDSTEKKNPLAYATRLLEEGTA